MASVSVGCVGGRSPANRSPCEGVWSRTEEAWIGRSANSGSGVVSGILGLHGEEFLWCRDQRSSWRRMTVAGQVRELGQRARVGYRGGEQGHGSGVER